MAGEGPVAAVEGLDGQRLLVALGNVSRAVSIEGSTACTASRLAIENEETIVRWCNARSRIISATASGRAFVGIPIRIDRQVLHLHVTTRPAQASRASSSLGIRAGRSDFFVVDTNHGWARSAS